MVLKVQYIIELNISAQIIELNLMFFNFFITPIYIKHLFSETMIGGGDLCEYPEDFPILQEEEKRHLVDRQIHQDIGR